MVSTRPVGASPVSPCKRHYCSLADRAPDPYHCPTYGSQDVLSVQICNQGDWITCVCGHRYLRDSAVAPG